MSEIMLKLINIQKEFRLRGNIIRALVDINLEINSGDFIIVQGPTGCGKTRFLEHITRKLSRPLITISCHEDLTASDLVGRYLLRDNETVWQDGPLSLAVKHGAICYLDEAVEARKDTTVVIHPLTDNRRILPQQ